MSQLNNTRSRRTAEEWKQLLEAYAASGLDQKQFCREQGLGYSTFAKWKKRLVTGKPVSESPLFELAAPLVDSPTSWDIELALGAGMVLRIRRS